MGLVIKEKNKVILEISEQKLVSVVGSGKHSHEGKRYHISKELKEVYQKATNDQVISEIGRVFVADEEGFVIGTNPSQGVIQYNSHIVDLENQKSVDWWFGIGKMESKCDHRELLMGALGAFCGAAVPGLLFK